MEENYLSQANLEAIKETLQLEILKRGINAPIIDICETISEKTSIDYLKLKKSDFLKLFSTKDIINSSPGFFCVDKIDTKSFVMLNAAEVIVRDNKLFNLWSKDGADICLRFGEKKKLRDFEVYIEKLNHMDEFLVIREIIDNIQVIENEVILSSEKDYTFTFEDITVHIPKGI